MVRDWWTQKLQRIIHNIEAGKMPVPIRELYVFGAYARGEFDPAELNLIVIHDEPSLALLQEYQNQRTDSGRSVIAALGSGMRSFERHFHKLLRRPTERINIYHGQHLNQAYIPTKKEHEGLVFLWSPADRDWLGKLATIPLADNHGAACLQPLAIPLPDSLREEAAYLSQLVAKEQLTMQRIPFEDLPPMSMQEALGYLAAPDLLDRWGVQTKPLFPYACAWLATHHIQQAIATDGCIVFDHEFRYRIQLGQPHFRKMLKHFDRSELVKQCYIPFLKRGYPKEMFVFERGSTWIPTQE